MLVFFGFSCYLNWSCHFVLIFHFFNSLFYYPIWIVIDVSYLISFFKCWSLEHTLKARKLMSPASLVSNLLVKTNACEDIYHWWYFYDVLLFQFPNLYVLQVYLRMVVYHLFLFHMWILRYYGNHLI